MRTLWMWCIFVWAVLLCGCHEIPHEGKVSETIVNLEGKLSIEEAKFLVKMPFEVQRISTFALRDIDSATEWVRLAHNAKSGLPWKGGEGEMIHGPSGIAWCEIEGTSLARFDGTNWTIFEFIPGFQKCSFDGYSEQTLYIGTSDYSWLCCGEGAQGLCVLRESGLVERIFYPPLLAEWANMPLEERLERIHSYEYPNSISNVRCSSPNTVWCSVYGAVFSLDFDDDHWRLFDRSNSPINGEVLHIAAAQGRDLVRCVCRTPGEKGQGGEIRVIRIENHRAVLEDPIPGAHEIVDASNSVIFSDRAGSLWYCGKVGIWKSTLDGFSLESGLPDVVNACGEIDHCIMDASGRYWISCKWHSTEPFLIRSSVFVQAADGWKDLSKSLFGDYLDSSVAVESLSEDSLGRVWICWRFMDNIDKQWRFLTSVLGKDAMQSLLRCS